VPDHKGFVSDYANVLSREEARLLESKIQSYREQSGNEIAVLIVHSLDGTNLEDFAHDVFNSWGVGKKDKDNGVLFIAAIKDRKARVEVGYGLEGELTDLESGRLVNRNSAMAQYFRRGEYAEGVDAVIDDIISAIGGEFEPKEEDDERGSKSLPGILPIIIIAVIVLSIMNRFNKPGGRHFGGPFIGGMILGSMMRRGGGFRVGGGSFGGGGFGGGSSGGGGASGGW
jgi:uncharacterized protein